MKTFYFTVMKVEKQAIKFGGSSIDSNKSRKPLPAGLIYEGSPKRGQLENALLLDFTISTGPPFYVVDTLELARRCKFNDKFTDLMHTIRSGTDTYKEYAYRTKITFLSIYNTELRTKPNHDRRICNKYNIQIKTHTKVISRFHFVVYAKYSFNAMEDKEYAYRTKIFIDL